MEEPEETATLPTLHDFILRIQEMGFPPSVLYNLTVTNDEIE
ncbi:MAG: hypothetical protein BROFUL_03337 [Candidatus Brocadia fulgida]|uniref:Uncharacterized protein n=1 Tax=Candidatus Brocadia fulgida TaxID=380242 RepID=A0A0M2UQN4_9BACT|nr:MAG: hypothetical protein BROFUL_03337 [Candidatus Brocadia fulgida]